MGVPDLDQGDNAAEEKVELMDRRDFLVKSTFFLTGSLFGLNRLSTAFAGQDIDFNPQDRPRIALIIDDIGYSASRAHHFLDLGTPITFSILPRLAHSRELAREIHEKGHEVMLHQPMEPRRSGIDPGPGALFVDFEADRIRGIMEENLEIVPFVAGVNNHMGSRFTECPAKIGPALSVAEKKGLFFVDSLTTSRSVGYSTARRLNMDAACRNIFLDNIPEENTILSQLEKLKSYALRHGSAIGIGHPYRQTAQAVARFLEDFHAAGISLVQVSEVI